MEHGDTYAEELALRAKTSQEDYIKAEASASQNPNVIRDLTLLGYRTRAVGYEAKNRIVQRLQRAAQTNKAPQ